MRGWGIHRFRALLFLLPFLIGITAASLHEAAGVHDSDHPSHSCPLCHLREAARAIHLPADIVSPATPVFEVVQLPESLRESPLLRILFSNISAPRGPPRSFSIESF